MFDWLDNFQNFPGDWLNRVNNQLTINGLAAKRPTAASWNKNLYYFATDTGALSWSSGTAWIAAGSLPAFNTLATAYPALGDTLPEYNAAAATNKGVVLSKVGGVLNPGLQEARLTLTSGTAVTTADVTAATSIYLTAFGGNRYATFDGTGWIEYALTSDLSLPLQQAINATYSSGSPNVTLTSGNTSQMVPGMTPSGTMQTDFSGGSILKITGSTTLVMSQNAGNNRTALASSFSFAASTIYDVFVVDNSGSPLLVPSNGWTSTTARADALGTQDGVDVNANAIVMGSGGITSIAANAGKYVGTFYSSGGTCTDSLLFRYLWNRYNPAMKNCESTDTVNRTTTSASVYVQVGAVQFSFILGLATQFVRTEGQSLCWSGSANGGASLSIGSAVSPSAVEATGAIPGQTYVPSSSNATVVVTTLSEAPAIGLTTRYLLFCSDNAGHTAHAAGNQDIGGGSNATTVLRAMIQC